MQEKFRYCHRLKVRYSEVDTARIVFNANYSTYFFLTTMEYFEQALGLDLTKLSEEGKFSFVITKSTIEFKSPARLGDWLNIFCRVKKIGNTSFTMEYAITKDGSPDYLVAAEIIYVSLDLSTHTPVPVPDFIREKIDAYESAPESLKETNK